MDNPRHDPWLLSSSGVFVRILTPTPEMFPIEDIAHGLAKKDRFSGQAREFYSVAQHSVAMSEHTHPDHAMWALLHDAAEHILPDVPRPLKRIMWVEMVDEEGDAQLVTFEKMEHKMLRVVAARYHLSWPMPSDVKHADNAAMATEARDFMPPEWLECEQHREWMPWPERLRSLPWQTAEEAFIQRYHELGGY